MFPGIVVNWTDITSVPYMKRLYTPSVPTARLFQVLMNRTKALSRTLLAAALVFASLVLTANPARGQTLQLRMPFTSTHGSGTTTPSDTGSGGINISMQMLNPAGTAQVDLNGAPGTGVTNNIAVNTTAAMDFTSNYTPSQQNQPVSNPADTLVFSSSGRDVLLTMVAGKEIYRDGRVSTASEEELRIRLTEIRSKFEGT